MAGSPYIVTSSVLVQEGVKLTIEPGVEVRFNQGLALQVNGELIARGTAEAPIAFTSSQAEPAPGDWAFILFTDTSLDALYDATGDYVSGSIIEHSVVEYAGFGVDPHAPRPKAAIRILYSGPLVAYSTIKDNEATGIGAQNGSLRVANSTITRNAPPLERGEFWGGGIHINGGIAILEANLVSANTATYAGGIYAGGGTTTLYGNKVMDNTSLGTNSGWGGGGVVVVGGTPSINNNTIMRNTALSRGGGILVYDSNVTLTGNLIGWNTADRGGGLSSEWGSPTLLGNRIVGNIASGSEGGIYVENPYSITVSNNTIIRNTSGGDGAAFYIQRLLHLLKLPR